MVPLCKKKVPQEVDPICSKYSKKFPISLILYKVFDQFLLSHIKNALKFSCLFFTLLMTSVKKIMALLDKYY